MAFCTYMLCNKKEVPPVKVPEYTEEVKAKLHALFKEQKVLMTMESKRIKAEGIPYKRKINSIKRITV